LKKMDKSLSHVCWHGCGEAGTLIHLMWYCPKVNIIRKDLIYNLSYILKVKIALCPLICLLGSRAAVSLRGQGLLARVSLRGHVLFKRTRSL
uniref:Uncharacterized protein n=1 Tax=Gadus morhua TaxID=8049 RepID=A0A8C5AUG7_GADMO